MIPRPVSRLLALGVGLGALIVWAALAAVWPRAALQGWLIGFVYVGGIPIGSLAVALIHRLTGGRWGAPFAAEIEPAARATPVLLLFMLPVLVGLPQIYAWAADPSALDAGVRRLYLNPPFFIVRTVVAIGGLSLAAQALDRLEGRHGRLWAALALTFYGVMATVIGVDWILSTRPSFTSSDIGMDVAVQQLGAGFAFAALQGRRRAPDAPSGDIAGLLFATLVGVTYLEFMSYLVVWYGDRPALDGWYIPRVDWPWKVLPWIALALNVVALGLLAARRAFGTHRAAAWVGASLLTALLAYQLWLLAPAFGAACLVPALFALLAQGGLMLALAGGAPRLLRHQARRDAVHAR